jgi:hypothetical protein
VPFRWPWLSSVKDLKGTESRSVVMESARIPRALPSRDAVANLAFSAATQWSFRESTCTRFPSKSRRMTVTMTLPGGSPQLSLSSSAGP